jgi:hypothetical protein
MILYSRTVRSERYVSHVRVPDLVDVTGLTILTPSIAVFGTKESSWQGRVLYQGCLLCDSVCFRLQFERRSHGGVAPLRVRKQVECLEAFSNIARSQRDQQFGTCTERNVQGHTRSHG